MGPNEKMIFALLIVASVALAGYLAWTILQTFRLYRAEKAFFAILVKNSEQNTVQDFLQKLESTFRANQADLQEVDKLILSVELIITVLEPDIASRAYIAPIFSPLKQPSDDGRAHYLFKLYGVISRKLPREKFVPPSVVSSLSAKNMPAEKWIGERTVGSWNTPQLPN